MRKPIKVFLLLATILVFAGAVSAEDSEINVTVTDQNNVPVTVVNQGDEVWVKIGVQSNDNPVPEPSVNINVDPGVLQFKPEEAMMAAVNPLITPVVNDITVPAGTGNHFFYQNLDGTWTIDLDLMAGDMAPNEEIGFGVPAIVVSTGDIRVLAAFNAGGPQGGLVALDEYIFSAVASQPTPTPSSSGNNPSVNAAGTIGLQETGLPAAGLFLAVLALFAGLASSKRK